MKRTCQQPAYGNGQQPLCGGVFFGGGVDEGHAGQVLKTQRRQPNKEEEEKKEIRHTCMH